jgi:hypothetical protein
VRSFGLIEEGLRWEPVRARSNMKSKPSVVVVAVSKPTYLGILDPDIPAPVDAPASMPRVDVLGMIAAIGAFILELA